MNYQHLLYFRTVAVLGSISAAAQRLRLTPPTLSAQIRALEETTGVVLFDRSARGMTLTDAGLTALRYADRIFALGAELEHSLRGDRARVFRVGVENSFASATARPLIARLALSSETGRIVCTFGPHEELFAKLRGHDLDVVLAGTDGAILDLDVRLVVESELAFFGSRATAERLRAGFPGSLDGAPFIAPPRTAAREAVDRWLARHGVRVAPTVELGDASLAAALAADGVGIVVMPTSAELELRKRYDLALIGTADGVRSQIHAIGSTKALDELLPVLLGEETRSCAQ